MALVNLNSLYDLVPEDGPVGDMASLEGPAFDYPLRGGENRHIQSLTGLMYSPIHDQAYGPVSQDLDGLEGPTFQIDNPSSTLQTSLLTEQYYSSIHNKNYGPGARDLNGLEGPTFDNGLEPDGLAIDTIHETSLEGIYYSTVHNLPYGPSDKDRPNITEYIQFGQLPEGLGALQG